MLPRPAGASQLGVCAHESSRRAGGRQELTQAGLPRVFVVSAQQQPRQADEQQRRQEGDELPQNQSEICRAEADLNKAATAHGKHAAWTL